MNKIKNVLYHYTCVCTFFSFILSSFECILDKPAVLDPLLEDELSKKNIQDPIILWWTPFTGDQGTVKKCGKVNCFFTINRHYRSHPKTRVKILIIMCRWKV